MCAYRHDSYPIFRKDADILTCQIYKPEEFFKVKEAEEVEPVQWVNGLQRSEKEKCFET